MGRKKNCFRKPIPNVDRVRMCRQRKQLKQIRQQQLLQMSNSTVDESNTNNSISDRSASEQSTLKWKLMDWVNTFVISKTAVDSLLAILNPYCTEPLPKNHRTLLKTPVNVEINENAGGHLWYNGLEKSLKEIFSTLNRDIDISLNFNIDGLNLHNSSTKCFWPILANIHGT